MPADPERRPTEGELVHYVLLYGPHAGEHRPAWVVRRRGDSLVDCRVMTLGLDDGANYSDGFTLRLAVSYDGAGGRGGTWHFPEVSDG